MRKKIFISLLCAVLITALMGTSNASAFSLKIDLDVPNNNDLLKINKKDAEQIYKEALAELKYQLYIEKNWSKLPVEQDMDLYNSQDKSLGKPGDILIAVFDTNNSDINAIMMGSLTTHAAFVDSDPHKVLEVLPDGIQNGENDWKTRYKKVLVLRPKLDEKTITNAIEFGHTQINKPFNFNFFDKTRTDKFYCSQFVWRCFYNSGADLDGNGGKAVFPYDFIQSDKVSIVYKQGE